MLHLRCPRYEPAFNDVIKTDFLANGIPKKEIITLV